MSRYTDPKSVLDVFLEAMVGLFVALVIFWLMVWILSRIWLWVVGALLLAAGIWLFVTWRRWRNSHW